MAKLVVIGALALDRPIRLSGPPAPGARLTGRSLEGALAGRLGGGGANAGAALPSLPAPGAETIDGLYVRAPYPGAGAWAEASVGPVVAHWPCPGFEGPCDVLVASADDCDAVTRADPLGAGRAQVGGRLSSFVMTHGADKVVAHGAQGRIEASPPPATVVDATGAGDVFAAGLLDALVAGAGMDRALRHACGWGATAVGVEGSAPLDGDFRPAAT